MSIWYGCGRDAEGIDHLVVILHSVYVDGHFGFSVQRDQRSGRDGKRQRRKTILTHVLNVLPSAICIHIYRCMPASMAQLEKLSPVPATLTTALLGMNALPRKGSRCHHDNCNDGKLENTHPDPFNSNTYMKFNSRRLTSSRGGAVSAAIISEVRLTGGCVTTLGSTADGDGDLHAWCFGV